VKVITGVSDYSIGNSFLDSGDEFIGGFGAAPIVGLPILELAFDFANGWGSQQFGYLFSGHGGLLLEQQFHLGNSAAEFFGFVESSG